VWLVDLPGYGASPKPGHDVSLDEHVSALVDALELAGIENPMLIGHSWGCQVVTLLAHRHPDFSDRLVLLSPTINPARRGLWMQFIDLLRAGLVEPVRVTAFAVYSYLFRARLGYYLAQLPHMIDDPMEERLPRVTAKVLVVRGENDPIVPAEWATRVADLLPNGRVVTVPGAHAVMYTAAREIAALIKGLAK
jgi:pimeloyl-ACP methyl ester carboxylesterase